MPQSRDRWIACSRICIGAHARKHIALRDDGPDR